MKTNAEIFHTVKAHMLAQGHKSTTEDRGMMIKVAQCMYRGPNGDKCAIGCLIPDDKYTEGMESMTVGSLLDHFPDLCENLGIDPERYAAWIRDYDETGSFEDVAQTLKMLQDLQNLHDMNKCRTWASDLAALQAKYNIV